MIDEPDRGGPTEFWRFSQPCPKCDAVGYEPCLTPKRNPRKYSHIDRVRQERKAQRESGIK